jgi:hypothetical protein
MDMPVQVTSYSSDPLDSSLFEVPAGYSSIMSDVARELA